MKKRIVIARSNGVDPDSRVEKEANSLAKNGYDVTILAWDRSSNYRIRVDRKKLQNTTVKRISFGSKANFGEGFKSLKPFTLFQMRLAAWLFKHHKEYDAVHLCDFDTGFTGIKVAKFFHKKVIYDIFDYSGTDAKSFFDKTIKRWEDNIINNADATIICTDERKRQIKGTNPKLLTVIHNTPADISVEEKPCKNNPSNRMKIAYVGILQDYRLLKEMVHAIERMNDVELHIGGFGKLDKYIKDESKHHDNIIYYGKLEYQDTLALENSCDIMTAIYDPEIGNHRFAAPNKFYEALFLGKPLIMVKGTGMSQIVKNEGIGVLIDYTEESFVDGVRQLISEKDSWPTMKQNMQNLYMRGFSWNEMERRLCGLYDQIFSS